MNKLYNGSKIGKKQKVIKFEKISGKDDILIVEDNQVDLIGNNKKRSLENNPRQRELDAKWSKMASMRI